MSNWTFSGIRELEMQLKRKIVEIGSATSDGLTKAAEHLLNASLPLVPVDTGRLKASGKVTEFSPLTKYVSYEAVDPDTGYEYAPIQHETLSFKHKVGQAKYLEEPFRNEMSNMVEIIADEAKKGVNK